MLKQYVITPDVFEPSAINEMRPPGVVLIELLRGIAETGLLSNLHGGQWMTAVRRFLQDQKISADVRERIERCLKQLHDLNRLIRHPEGSPDFAADDFRWLRWSLERHHVDPQHPLDGVFATDEYLELLDIIDPVLVRLSDALNHSCWLSCRRAVRFQKVASNLRKYLGPLVRYAQKVWLIDPYLTCREDRFLDTVQECAHLLGNRDGRQHPGTIIIHAGDPLSVGPENQRESHEKRLEKWEQELQGPANQWGHKFHVFLWGRGKKAREGHVGGQPHDRYIITDQCGITVPGGLDFLPDEQTHRAQFTIWGFLEPADRAAIVHTEFHRDKSPYGLLGSIGISPAPTR